MSLLSQIQAVDANYQRMRGRLEAERVEVFESLGIALDADIAGVQADGQIVYNPRPPAPAPAPPKAEPAEVTTPPAPRDTADVERELQETPGGRRALGLMEARHGSGQ